MAISNPPAFLQNAGSVHTAELLRNAMGGMFNASRASSSLVPRSGVHPNLGETMAVTQQGSPTMGVMIQTGLCYVAGTEGVSQGVYAVYAPTTTNLAITAAHASLSRIDLIVVRVQDSAYSGASNTVAFEVVAGTAAGSPSAPATPANSLVLAQVLVGPGVTSIVNANITDRRFLIAMGTLPVPTVADLPTFGRYHGMTCY